jgi:hypothetical protein
VKGAGSSRGKAEKAGKNAESNKENCGGCLLALSLFSIYRWWLARVKRGL